MTYGMICTMNKFYKAGVLFAVIGLVLVFQNAFVSAAVTPAAFNLQEGNTVSANGSSDPDIYIINSDGYKRLFLNPVIFNMYGHLKGFAAVKPISAQTRDAFTTTTLFTNCETKDGVVYALEVKGEDTGLLHRINVSKETALSLDSNFEKKTFCINNREFNWYPKGEAYTSLSQIPPYYRTANIDPAFNQMMLETQKRLFSNQIFSTAAIRSSEIRLAGNWTELENGSHVEFAVKREGTSHAALKKDIGRLVLERYSATSPTMPAMSVGPWSIEYRLFENTLYLRPTALAGLNLSQYENKWYQVDLNEFAAGAPLELDSLLGTNAEKTQALIVAFLHEEFSKPAAQNIIGAYPLFVVRADHGIETINGQATRHMTVQLNKLNLEAFTHAFTDYAVRENIHGRFIDVLKNAGVLTGYTDAQIAEMKVAASANLAQLHTSIQDVFSTGDMDAVTNFPLDVWVATNDYDMEKINLVFPLDALGGIHGAITLTISSFPSQDITQITIPTGAELFKTAFQKAFGDELQRVFGL